ncbi:MAG: DNA-binding response regulator [Thermoleophilia bacterium]|nr:DNA-binding response regulator [Thermoleophilia bacterium]
MGMRDTRATVLVIDDDYAARLQVELAILASDKLRMVGEASNGMRGAELAEQLHPDIVVLDLSMPVMDGFEALPLLRTMAPGARVIVRSSNDDPDIADRVRRLGAAAFLPKFMRPEELQASIEDAVPQGSPVMLVHTAALRAMRRPAVTSGRRSAAAPRLAH